MIQVKVQVEAVKKFSFSASRAIVGLLPSSLDELPFDPRSFFAASPLSFLLDSGAFLSLQLHFWVSLINLLTC